MDLRHVPTLIAAVLFVLMGLVTALRGRQSPLAPSLGVLVTALAAYAILDTVSDLTQQKSLFWASSAAAAVAGAASLELCLGFVGVSRQHRTARHLGRLYFGLLAAACAVPLVAPDLGDVLETRLWPIGMAGGIVAVLVITVATVSQHWRRSGSEERARSQLLGAALASAPGELFSISS